MDANVSQFMAVTGASSDVAVRLLEACSGNLDLAINMHLESGESPVPTSAGASTSTSSGTETTNNVLSPKSYEELYGIRAPIPQTRGVLVEEATPPRRVLRSRRLPQTVFDPFQDYSKVAASSSRKLPGPGNDAKKKSLAELFKPPHDIMFHGSFHEARLAGEHKQKWVLVNVQDSKEFASQVLNRDVWSNHNVKDVIRENFIFWQIHRITDDGIKFKQLYHIENYPYIAVIDPRTGENMAHWNSLSANEFTAVIQEFLATHHYDDGDHQLLDSRKSSVVELSEQSQLEAAIQASIQDCQSSSNPSNKTSKYELVFSDSDDDENDPVSVSSDAISDMDETDGGWNNIANVVDVGSDGDVLTHASTKSPLHIESPSFINSSSDTNFTIDKHNPPFLEKESKQELIGKSRKRTFSQSSAQDHQPRKIRKSSTTKNIDRSHHIVTRSQRNVKSDCCEPTEISNGQPPSRYRNRNTSVANGARSQLLNCDSSSTSTTSTTVEKLVETGAIGKDEVSHILFRLPDGTRVQKTFICSHPIKELFDFLRKQGLDTSEHEVVTHFPRRSVSEINQSINFKNAGLYPRETLFVHTAE